MQLAPHLPKQPVFTVLDRQTCFHNLSQAIHAHQTKSGPVKMPGPPYAAECCVVLQLAVLYAVLWATVLQENGAPSFPPSLALPTPRGAQYSGRTVHVSIATSSRVPDDRPPIGNPTPPVSLVRRPAPVDGHCHLPHDGQLLTPPGGSNSPERVDRVSFGVAMLTIRR